METAVAPEVVNVVVAQPNWNEIDVLGRFLSAKYGLRILEITRLGCL